MNTLVHQPISVYASPSADTSLLERTIARLDAELASLRAEADLSRSEIRGLQDRCHLLEVDNASLREEVALERALDRKRLAKLELVEAQPIQRDRGEVLRALVAANGGKMMAKAAREKMHLDKATFSHLLDTLTEHIDTKPFHGDKRKLVLVLKNS